MVSPAQPRHGYASVDNRLVHYVTCGRGPAVILLHASPGDARTLAPLIGALGDDICAIALDTPAHGMSDPLAAATPSIDDYGAALVDTLSALQLDRVHLYGTHTGAKIGLSAALQAPHRIASLTLDGVGISTPAERSDQLARYTPTWPPRTDGSHLVQAWHQVRNMFLFWPWYTEQRENCLHDAMPPVADLHNAAHGLLLAGDRYPLAYRAAFQFDPTPALTCVTVPTTIVASPDDPLRAHIARLDPLPETVQIDPSTSDLASRAAVVRANVAANSGGQDVADLRLRSTPGGPRQFITTALGDVHVSTGTEAPADTVVVAPLGARLDADPGDSTLVIELPGSGRSTLGGSLPLDLSVLAECLTEVCATAGAQPHTVRASGSSAAAARELAFQLHARLETSGLGGRIDPTDLPDLSPRPDGTHLLMAWHLVRDAALAHLGTHGRWPGSRGDMPDLELIQARTISLTGSWMTLPLIYAACAGDAAATAADRPGMWDPLASGSRRPAD